MQKSNSVMAVIFKQDDHSYHSTDPNEDIRWISVTTVVSALKKPFDPKAQSIKSAKNKRSKWYGMTPTEIQEAWSNEAKRAIDLGTFYHNQREADLILLETLSRGGVTVPVVKPPMLVDGVKAAPEQKLHDGVYPEHFVYLKSAGVCGQSDLVEVVDGVVSITDYKTNKEIRTEGYRSWDGVTEKMLPPVAHLDNCNFNHYTLQLSIYMYIILKHNPTLKPGKMMLHHIIFETDGADKYGNPIHVYNDNGDPKVKEVRPLEVPYLKREVIDIIHWLHDHRDEVKKH